MVETLTPLEDAVIRKVLEGDHPLLAALRKQAGNARLRSREFTGAGFYTSLHVEPESMRAGDRDYQLDDVLADIEGLAHGAGFILYVRAGFLDLLEGFSYDESWPAQIGAFAVKYQREPRVLHLPGEGPSPPSPTVVRD